MPIAATHPFISSLEHILGFLVVLIALMLLWGLTVLLGVIFKRSPQPDPVSISGPAEEIDEEEVAAIAAVVSCLMGRRSRIVSIRSAATKDWNREGRREHFASHKIR
ncbi:OadG family protein [Puniceicoccales bacterium CK1056]|uniref:OadG family protein n=1 Tax=Oceanipulchritudo coccoides TaxID=2706888 RepID=A0A6B2M3N5_9BACT|nr:OadG family protein [Oceanipulchritudo coccoides]NDV62819.1 OadG family protein [Oceanipulchritudo coccoides]